MALNIGELTGFLSLDPTKFQQGASDALATLKSKDWQKAGAGAGALAAGALAVGFKGAVDLRGANAKTAAQLNLTKDEAGRVGKVTGDLYSQNFGESMGSVSDAMGAVIGSFEGLRDASEEELEAAGRAALSFAEVMEVDVGAAATTAGTLVQNGLAKDATGAFDLLTAAAQEVGPQMVEPLMDATDEYAKHFAMLGFTGEQTMTTLAAAAAGGEISIDKAGDAIKEFGIRATDLNDTGAQEALEALGLSGTDMANDLLAGGERAQEATQTISDALLSVEDPAERAALAGGLFGTQVEDMGKDQLPGFLEALSGAGDGLGDVAGRTDEAMAAVEEGGGALQRFGRGVQTELIDMMTGAVDWLSQGEGGMEGLVRYTKPAVIALGAFAGVVGLVSLALKIYNSWAMITKVATGIATAAQWAWNAALTANPIGLVVLAIAALVGGLYLFFTRTEKGQEIWGKVWGFIKRTAAAVADWFTGTLVPILSAAWDAIASAALWVYDHAIKPAWAGIKSAISAVAGWVTGTLVPWLQGAWEAIASAAMWLWEKVLQPAWTGIRLAIAVAVTAILVYIDLLKWYFNNVIAPVAIWLWKSVLAPAWEGIRGAIGAVVDWFQNTAWPALKSAWDAVAGAAMWLWNSVLKPAWAGIQAAIAAVVAWFRDTAWPWFRSVIDMLQARFLVLQGKLKLIWAYIQHSVIQPVLSWFRDVAWPLIQRVIGYVIDGFHVLRDALRAAWSFIRDKVIGPVAAWFRDTVWAGILSPALENVKRGFNLMRDALGKAWSYVKDKIIAPVANWFRDTLAPTFERETGRISDAFDTMKEGVKKAWNAIKDAARAPVRFVVEDIYNDSIRSTFNGVAEKLGLESKWRLPRGKVGFATGGIMPGYTPGRDVHRFVSPTGGVLDLSGGEPILRPEAGRVLGSNWVHGINAAARSGGTGGVSKFLDHHAYAGGGIWGKVKGAAGGAAEWMRDKASTITNAMADPFGTLTQLAGKAAGLIPGAGMLKAVMGGTVKHAAEGVGQWLKDKVGIGGGDTPGNPGVGTGGSLGWAANLARQYGLTMTSGYRPGAVTATGSPSMHGQNRARDFSNGYRPTTQMMQFALAVLRGSRPTELLYTPLGALNMHRGGRQYANTGATARGHQNHVHVAYRDGGIMAALGGYADGTLNASPGWHMVGEEGPELVRFRGGEQVLTAEETRRLGNTTGQAIDYRAMGAEMKAAMAGVKVEMRVGHRTVIGVIVDAERATGRKI